MNIITLERREGKWIYTTLPMMVGIYNVKQQQKGRIYGKKFI